MIGENISLSDIHSPFFEYIINILVDTVFIFDPKTGKPVKWNKAFRDISGYTDEEISKKKAPDEWYDEEDRKELINEMIELLDS